MEEAAGGAVFGKSGEADSGFGALLYGQVAARIHIGFYAAGVRGVDFQGRAFGFCRLLRGQQIQRGLAAVINRKQPGVGQIAGTVDCDGGEYAAVVHDAARRGRLQQRQEAPA